MEGGGEAKNASHEADPGTQIPDTADHGLQTPPDETSGQNGNDSPRHDTPQDSNNTAHESNADNLPAEEELDSTQVTRCPRCNVLSCSACGSVLDGNRRTRHSLPPFSPRSPRSRTASPQPESRKRDEPFFSYKNIYKHATDDEVLYQCKVSDLAEPVSGDPENDTYQVPVAEIEAEYRSAKTYRRFQILTHAPPVLPNPRLTIVLRSPAVIEAVKSVITYYPSLSATDMEIRIEEPFRPLVHHFEELEAYRDNLAPENELRKEVTLLLGFLEERIMSEVNLEKERHTQGRCTWNMLWLLFKPGEEVCATAERAATSRSGLLNRVGAIVESITPPPTDLQRSEMPDDYRYRRRARSLSRDRGVRGPSNGWSISLWSLAFDGVALTRKRHYCDIYPFGGEMNISNLPVVPMKYSDSLNVFIPGGVPLREYLVSQGKKFFEHLSPKCVHHYGEVLEFPFHKADGVMMVDVLAYFEQEVRLAERFDDCGCRPGLLCARCAESILHKFKNDLKYGNNDDIRPENVKELTDLQYFLCPHAVPAYSFKTREWELVDVSNISPPKFNPTMIEKLVMKDRRLDLLKNLSKNFLREDRGVNGSAASQTWTADFIKGKGNSLIFLLHGPPGVGKTYTAECIAEFVERPLMTLTASDIGVDSEALERNLEKNFKLAKKWGAILLIDEADIYLERRVHSDLKRNSLVAGFLRVLEIYDGILMLTTNRVGAFDDAFISRVHIQLHYPALGDTERKKIWINFMDKLEKERGKQIRIKRDAKDYLLEGKQVRDLKLNGREIRNIFQTAVGLAEYEHEVDDEGLILLQEKHLSQVAEMSGEFKTYLDKLHLKTESERAAIARLRLDMEKVQLNV